MLIGAWMIADTSLFRLVFTLLIFFLEGYIILVLYCSILFGFFLFFFFSSRRRHTRLVSDWSSDVCSSDLPFGKFYRDRAYHLHFSKSATGHDKICQMDRLPISAFLGIDSGLRLWVPRGGDKIGRASCRERV